MGRQGGAAGAACRRGIGGPNTGPATEMIGRTRDAFRSIGNHPCGVAALPVQRRSFYLL